MINGDGEQQRDFVYRGGLREGQLSRRAERPSNGIYNLGCGRGTTVNEIFAGLKLITSYTSEPKHGPEKLGETRRIYLDASKVAARVGLGADGVAGGWPGTNRCVLPPGRDGTGMIVVQTPLRVSLFGGGTDFPAFYHSEGGCVLSTAIDKYIYVVIKSRFDEKLRVGYSRTEMVDSVDEIQHELIREALRTIGDSPGCRDHDHRRHPVGRIRAGFLQRRHGRGAARACTPTRARSSRPSGWREKPVRSRSRLWASPSACRTSTSLPMVGCVSSSSRPTAASRRERIDLDEETRRRLGAEPAAVLHRRHPPVGHDPDRTALEHPGPPADPQADEAAGPPGAHRSARRPTSRIWELCCTRAGSSRSAWPAR